MMLLPGREDEYCVRMRMVADLPRWKAGEWSPLSCVSVPPPHSTVAPRVGVDTDGQVTAVVGQKVAVLRCVLWGAAVVVVQANWLKASRGNVWAGANLAALSPLHGTAYSNSSLAGRLRFRVGGPPGDVSLELLDVRAGDGGLFLCHVATFPHGNYEGRVSLSVIEKAAAAGRAGWAAPATILGVSLALVATLLLLLPPLYRRRRRRRRQRQRRHEPWGPTEGPPTLLKEPRRNAEGHRGCLLTLESGNEADEGLHGLPPQPQHQDGGAGSYDYAVFTDEDDDEAREEDF
ncbi:uncharacterized protein LOC142915554 isoform X2 [Petromyzon marinus]